MATYNSTQYTAASPVASHGLSGNTKSARFTVTCTASPATTDTINFGYHHCPPSWKKIACQFQCLGDRALPDVVFAGVKPYAEVPRYYGLASCFVLPSTSEPWGAVVNEAMACGLPVLVSDICGCVPELVFQGVNGGRGSSANYSIQRFYNFSTTYRANDRLRFAAGYSHSNADFRGISSIPETEIAKTNTNDRFFIGSDYALNRLLRFGVDFNHQRRSSDPEDFSYKVNSVTFSVRGSF